MTLSRAIVRTWMAAAARVVPVEVMASARLHMLDAVGVGLAASALDQGAAYRNLASGNNGAITVLTGARVSNAAEAALINGGLIHSLEYDDTHTASIVHGSSVLAPAALNHFVIVSRSAFISITARSTHFCQSPEMFSYFLSRCA